GPAPGDLDPVLGHRDDHLVPHAVLGIPKRAGERAPRGRAGPGSHRRHRLRRRAGPIPEAAPRAGRTLLPRHRLGRTRSRRSFPRRRRTAAARRNAARRLPATTRATAGPPPAPRRPAPGAEKRATCTRATERTQSQLRKIFERGIAHLFPLTVRNRPWTRVGRADPPFGSAAPCRDIPEAPHPNGRFCAE